MQVLRVLMLFLLATTALVAVVDGTQMPAAATDIAMPPPARSGVRLKDLVRIEGVRDNQLHGVGIVVGLEGSGDKSDATVGMLKQVLSRKQITVTPEDLNTENVAMVAVTADLPAFAANGSRLPTQVACIGDASSLRGGVLLQTPLVAADGNIYAVAQGPVSVGGSGTAGPNIVAVGKDHLNVETVGQMVEGALVEREVPVTLLYGNRLRLRLHNPDFTTANAVARELAGVFGSERVSALDASVITLGFESTPSEEELVATIARLEHLRVEPDTTAKVVINERTGTIVVGQHVRISPVAVSHGGLSLQVFARIRTRPDPDDPQEVIAERVWEAPGTPEPLSRPPPGVAPLPVRGSLALLAGASVEEIANGLNALGVRPRDLVAIFQALDRAGALHARLVVM
ncbi:MAG: flagellar basal body P-ring protein FlgI [Planctomycetota bacterium]